MTTILSIAHLSRMQIVMHCPDCQTPKNTGEGAESPVYTVNTVDESFPVWAEETARQTRLDPVLSKVHQFVLNG